MRFQIARLRALAVLALAALLTLPACKPSGDTSGKSGVKKVLRGGELRLPLSVAPDDPALVSFDFADYRLFALARATSLPLVRCSATGEIQPGLAASWSSNETGDVWTFGFDPAGQSGAEQFTRMVQSLLRGPDGPMRAQLSDLISGAKDYAIGKAESVSGLESVDGSLVIHLTRPHRYLTVWLSQPGLMPRPSKQEDGSWSSLGSFRIASISGAAVTLVRNPDYAGTKPLLDKLTFTCEPDFARQVEAFRAGALDAANVPMQDADDIAADETLAVAIRQHVTAQQLLGVFDQHQFPWGDQQFQPKTGLRQSLNWGLDRETLATILNGQFAPYPHFFPEEFKAFIDPALVSQPVYGLAVQTEDARRAQKEADHEQGSKLIPGMDLGYLANTDLDALDEELLKYWDEISVKMRPFPLSYDELRQRVEAGTHEILLSRCCPAYPDPDALAYPLLHSSLFGLGGNYSGLRDAELDQSIASGQAEADSVARRKVYQRLSRNLEEQASFVFLGYFTPTLLISPRVAGLRLGPYDFDASLPAQDFSTLGLAGD